MSCFNDAIDINQTADYNHYCAILFNNIENFNETQLIDLTLKKARKSCVSRIA